MSKYEPLYEYLLRVNENQILLTFNDIEEIIGSSLPQSARDHSAWWANSRTKDSHTWAHLWLKAGWEIDRISLKEEIAYFIRDNEIHSDSNVQKQTSYYEGRAYDRTAKFRSRNVKISNERKKRDNYTCQVCSFSLNINDKWVIEAHHLNPLSVSGEIVTNIDDLISLCPTCHRVAHMRQGVPYSLEELKTIRCGK